MDGWIERTDRCTFLILKGKFGMFCLRECCTLPRKVCLFIQFVFSAALFLTSMQSLFHLIITTCPNADNLTPEEVLWSSHFQKCLYILHTGCILYSIYYIIQYIYYRETFIQLFEHSDSTKP